jgi:hypothetical protein
MHMGEFPDLPPSLIELLHKQTEQKHLSQWWEEMKLSNLWKVV